MRERESLVKRERGQTLFFVCTCVCAEERVLERERELLSTACMKSAAEERVARGCGGETQKREKELEEEEEEEKSPSPP